MKKTIQYEDFRMEGSRLYVGNLTYEVNAKQLDELFSNYGEVKDVKVIRAQRVRFH